MSLSVLQDGTAALLASLKALTNQEVMVGIPSTRTDRLEKGEEINNATIGYIQENGSPANNIPARPHLVPGVTNAQSIIADRFRKATIAALSGNTPEVNRQLDAAGMAGASAVKAVLNAGVAPALAESTLKARARRGRKGAIQELANRADGLTPSVDLAKPLIDTAQYRNAITYVRRAK
jgi:hypothetical protein